MVTKSIPISDLYPYEPSVYPKKVAEYEGDYKNGKVVPPVEVVVVDGTTLVRNGNHRVAGAKKAGLNTIETRDITPISKSPSEWQPLRDALKQAEDAGQKGFENLQEKKGWLGPASDPPMGDTTVECAGGTSGRAANSQVRRI